MKKNVFYRRTVLILLPAIGLGVMALACGGKDDTEAIYALIQKGTELAEAKQVGDLMDLTIPDFVARPGGRDRRETKGILFGAFMHYGEFKIHYPRPRVELPADSKSANATIHFLIVRQDQSLPGLKALYDDPRKWIETAGEQADLYQLKLVLNKEGGDWLVRRAELGGFTGTGF